TSKSGINDYFKDYVPSTDKKVFNAMLSMIYNNLPQAKELPVFKSIFEKYPSSNTEETFSKFTDEVYSKTIFTDKEKVMALLNKPSKEMIENDPAYSFASKLVADYRNLVPVSASTNFQ